MNKSSHPLPAIGFIESCYKQKFGTPRQPGLVKSADISIILLKQYSHPDIIEGLEHFSHIWVLSYFHLSSNQGWKPKVRPPRLGGNQSTGLFSTRSPFRPSPVGISAIKLNKIDTEHDRLRLMCSGGDLVDGTPVLDIKPYIPYADSIPNAGTGYASETPEPRFRVGFSQSAEAFLASSVNSYPNLRQLIGEVLALDPRPQYRDAADPKTYGVTLYDFDIKWRLKDGQIWVESIAFTEPEKH